MNNVKRGYRLTIALLIVVLAFAAVIPLVLPTAEQSVSYASDYQSSYMGSYYEGIDSSLTGSALRNQLQKLITSTHDLSKVSYNSGSNGLQVIFQQTDIDPETGKLVLFYTGTQVSSFSSYDANREHVWPKDGGAAFPEKTGPGCDAHHLRPCDQIVNSNRSSLSFGETTTKVVPQGSTTNTSYGNLCYKDGSFFYPGKGYRGATARILMYMQTRWGTQYSLKFVDGAGKTKTIGDFDTLYKWHLAEPPSDLEIYRNEQVFKIQGNRNPFIDHPEYAYQIYSVASTDYYDSGDSVALANSVKSLTAQNDTYGNLNEVDAESISLSVSSLSLAMGQTYQVSVKAYPAGASNAVNWSTSNSSVATVNGGTITAKSQGTATITATLKANAAISASLTVNVKAISDIVIEGTPNKTTYTAGDAFDPTGLTVKCIYSDGTSQTISNSAVTWVDGVTGSTYLSQGTTNVIGQYGSFSKTVNGITVNKATVVAKTEVINRSCFTEENGSYAWQEWQTDGGLRGKVYAYAGRKDSIQVNDKKYPAFIFNTTACAGGIASVKIALSGSGQSVELFVSNTPFAEGDAPTGGTSLGTKTANGAAEWMVDGNYQYFALQIVANGASYVSSVTVAYGKEQQELPDDSVKLDKTTLTLTEDDTYKLTATASGTVTWTSSNSSVATVDQNGNVKAVGVGTATITATRGAATATCVVTVKAKTVIPDDSVTLDKTTLTLTEDDTYKLTATASGTVTWTSSNSSVATVDQNGNVKAVGVGTATVTATCGTATATCVITVNAKAQGGDEKTAAFIAAVEALNGSDNVGFDDIAAAVALYDEFDDSQKEFVQSQYQTLKEIARAYNQNVEKINDSVKTAFADSIGGVAVATDILLALMFVLKRKI